MAFENATPVPKINPIRRKPTKRDRPARGSYSSTGKRAATCVAREQDRPSALAGGDEELLAGLRAGSASAVDELLRLYQGKIFNLAMSILKNESDAEEAAQDVFMTVIRKADTFQGNSAFYSWMYRICVNTCLMRLRGKRRNETVSIEEFLPVFTDEGMHASPMDDWSKEVERDALNEELGRMIRKYTGELSGKYRVVFVLSDVEGLSNEETARILGLTVPAIKSRLHRARLYLRERLSRYLRDGSAGTMAWQPAKPRGAGRSRQPPRNDPRFTPATPFPAQKSQ
ncbi:MAG: sigma-70 family RNA polymerase sigma factor [bacterium]|jgi:RNA polymerase sigma-70 factor (ECF subfamily)